MTGIWLRRELCALFALVFGVGFYPAGSVANASGLPGECQVVPGDLTADSATDVLDVVALVTAVLSGAPVDDTTCAPCFEALAPTESIGDYPDCAVVREDTTGDGTVDVLDVVALVAHVLDTGSNDFLASGSACGACYDSILLCVSGEFDCLGVCDGSAVVDLWRMTCATTPADCISASCSSASIHCCPVSQALMTASQVATSAAARADCISTS